MSGSGLRVRITIAVMVAAILPVGVFGLLLVASGSPGAVTLDLIALVVAALVGLVVGGLLVGSVVGPLRALEARLERITAGEPVEPLPTLPDDELGRLAERQEKLAADLARRNRQVARAVDAITAWAPADGVAALIERAATDAREALSLIDARIVLGDPDGIEIEERIPGEPRPVSADLLSGREMAGVLVGHAAATMRWEPPDQDLLELFAASVAVALRDAALLARVEEQNARLVLLDAEKDDFLRGISHNLQTPLARIRAYADQLAAEQDGAATPDRRPGVIAEQSERLSRMVRQLLTVSRLDAGVIRPSVEVFALGPRVRRAWDALGAGSVPFELVDKAGGWLALADPDQADQVLWALLDNAVKYGAGSPVRVLVIVDGAGGRVAVTVADGGPGVADADRERLFARYARGGRSEDRDGTGLGLYVGRALARANGGDLVLEPAAPDLGTAAGPGAAFTLVLPAEAPTEG
ncbi:MAG TPA: ATP-binding protein [Candidatus Nanopelagicales bacterium]|nr:ATP-binding protein [Candidatus Nanopelagicales bacterium]